MQGYCTINCDASVRYSKCAFGARIYTDDIIAELCGPLDCHPDSNVAELAGVVTCLRWVNENCDKDKISIVVINCDNNRVKTIVNSGWMQVRDVEQSLRDELYALRDKFSKVYAKDIKGHSNSIRGRNIVNNRCDELASQGLTLEKLQVSTEPNMRNIPLSSTGFRVKVMVDTESYQFDVPAPNMIQAEKLIIDKLKESFKLITYGKEK